MRRATNAAVVGSTASGKSELALALAQHLGADVVNADSMQVYQGMDIGTAKLPPDQRLGVTHHLLDIWPVTKTASLAEYQRLALGVLEERGESGVSSLLVGGSGMYVQAVVDEWQIPGTDATVRARLESEMEDLGAAKMHERLEQTDPPAANTILPGDERRIVRALEVAELQGSFTAQLPAPSPTAQWVLLGVDLPRDELDKRIEQRVRQMWEQGLVMEVQRLTALGLRQGVTSSRALGYAQVLRYLDGEISEQQAREQTVVGTRRFSRRQLSWFRRDPRIHWLPVQTGPGEPVLLDAALAAIESASA